MAQTLYPDVSFIEEDQSVSITAAVGSIPAFVIRATKGPINKAMFINSEKDLRDLFGNPFNGTIATGVTFNNLQDWFSVSNYLSYANGCYVVRVEKNSGASAYNANIEIGATTTTSTVKVFDGTNYTSVTGFSADKLGIFAKYPGYYGNSISIAMYVADATDTVANNGYSGSGWYTYKDTYDDFEEFEQFPINGEVALIVYLDDVIVEKFILSLDENGKGYDGSNNFIDDYLKANSQYVSSYITGVTTSIASVVKTNLSNGLLETGLLVGSDVTAGFDYYANKNTIQIDYLVDGGYNFTTNTDTKTVHNYIAAIAAARKDCFAVLAPNTTDILNKSNADIVNTLINYKNSLSVSGVTAQFAAFYGQIKKMYNKYDDKYFWIPCSTDVIGNMVKTDRDFYPWYAVGGDTRGVIQNVVKLGFYPDDTYIGQLYSNGINTIKWSNVSGNVINGNRTLYPLQSAFKDINVRKLFTFCENTIANSLRAFLFEFNDEITRGNVSSIINNFLTTVKNNRGVYDFRVVCDTTNNTPSIIDNNELIVDIFIKPSRAIEFIEIRFVATRTDANFDEI